MRVRDTQVEKCRRRRDLRYRRERDVEREFFFLLKSRICWIILPLFGERQRQHFRREFFRTEKHSEKKLFSRKKHIFGTCWIFSVERTTFWAMLNFSAERTTFWVMLNFSPETSSFFQKSASFCWNVEYVRSCWMPFPKKVLLSAEMLNMLNMLNYFASIWSLLASHRPQKIQHIQHIQHFSRKKHIFQTLDPTWFNIFNISAERKHISNSIGLLSAEMLNMLNFLSRKGGSSF